MADFVWAVKLTVEESNESGRSSVPRPTSPSEGADGGQDNDGDWIDDVQDDDESGGEDSDDESLCNKLCTYTQTQKEFMNQHW